MEIQKAQLRELSHISDDLLSLLFQLMDAIVQQTENEKIIVLEDVRSSNIFHNLPQPDFEHFVGRDKEIEDIRRILRPYPDSRGYFISISGIGGVGKSALALEVAYRYYRGNMPHEELFDAIIWVSAKQTVLHPEGIRPRKYSLKTLEDVFTAIAVTLHNDDITKYKGREQEEAIRRALTKQRTLLIIDNLETVDDESVIQFLWELPPPTKAIITTRQKIDVTYPIPLQGMVYDDARNLITQECKRKQVNLTKTQIQNLYKRTGGLPLAMVWAIGLIAGGKRTGSVFKRLAEPTNDVAEFIFGDSVSFIEQEYPFAYQALLALSLFSTVSIEAIKYITDAGMLDVEEGLHKLLQVSLTNRVQTRYYILPMTKVYIQYRFDQSKFRDLFTERWVQWLIEWGQKYGIRLDLHIKDRVLIEQEYDNIITALKWCYVTHHWEQYLYLLEGVFDYMLISNLLNILQEIIEQAEEILLKMATLSTSKVLIVIGGYYYYQNRIEEARPFLKKAQEMVDKSGDPKNRALLLDYTAADLCSSNPTGAEKLARTILEIGSQENDPYINYLGYYRMGRAREYQGKDDSMEWLLKAANTAQENHWDRLFAWALYYSARLKSRLESRQKTREARDFYTRSMEIATLLGETILVNLNVSSQKLGGLSN